MNELIILFYLLWFLIAYYAIKYEEELRDIWKWAKETTDSFFEKEEEENEW